MNWINLVRDFLAAPFLLNAEDPMPAGVWGSMSSQFEPIGTPETRGDESILRYRHANGLEVSLTVRGFRDTRAVEIWGEVTHRGTEILKDIREVMTIATRFHYTPDFDRAWLRTINGVRFIPSFYPPEDFKVVDRQLMHTPQVYTPVVTAAGECGRSSARDLPFVFLCDESQKHGLAWSVDWSGLWKISVHHEALKFHDQKPHASIVTQIGIWGLSIDLKPGQSLPLPLPRTLMLAFDGNLDAGGNAVRRHIRRHVAPKLNDAEIVPPTSFNHWFAFENNFTAEMLRPAVKASGEAGLEYFCVDAAWFKGNFRDSIGNWEIVDESRFPEGIRPFSKYVEQCGMKYGTWFEPEFAHEDTKLYKDHPDWFLPMPSTSPWVSPQTWGYWDRRDGKAQSIRQMNFALRAVQDYWIELISRVYREWNMRWIRWDFNQQPRPAWDFEPPAGELGLKQIGHILGLYRVLDEIMKICPDLLIEQCASGGHRIDLGTVRRGHTFWMNDHTTQSDLVRALQQGLNTVLPGNYPNTNLCQYRFDYTDYDFLSHCCGPFGFSGRLHDAPPADFARFKSAVSRFKQFRHLLMGDFARPTGQPRDVRDPVEVRFSDGKSSVSMRWSGAAERTASVSF